MTEITYCNKTHYRISLIDKAEPTQVVDAPAVYVAAYVAASLCTSFHLNFSSALPRLLLDNLAGASGYANRVTPPSPMPRPRPPALLRRPQRHKVAADADINMKNNNTCKFQPRHVGVELTIKTS